MFRSKPVAVVAGALMLLGAVAGPSVLAQAGDGTSVPVVDCVNEPRPFDANAVDLTGTWRDPGDGIYYIGQFGDTVWWSGMSGRGGPADLIGRNWSNVAKGTLSEDLVLQIDWADVPRAKSTAQGTVWAQAEADALGNLQLTLIRDTGGSGVDRWTTCSVVSGSDPATLPPDGTYEADMTMADLIKAGMSFDDAQTFEGANTLVFEDGRFSIGGRFVGESTCEGRYEGRGRVIHLAFDGTDACEGTSDIQVAVAADGSLDIDWIDCGPRFCNLVVDRAFFDRVWTKTG